MIFGSKKTSPFGFASLRPRCALTPLTLRSGRQTRIRRFRPCRASPKFLPALRISPALSDFCGLPQKSSRGRNSRGQKLRLILYVQSSCRFIRRGFPPLVLSGHFVFYFIKEFIGGIS